MNKASVFQLYQHAPPIEFKSLSKWYELEHDRIVTHWDDYRGDLPTAFRQGFSRKSGQATPTNRDKF